MTRSPYELRTGPDVLARLHPRLRAYFGPVPPGHVGRGDGVFAVVGTPRRWLWPVLALLARDGIVFPVWERDVPFTVENRAARVGRGATVGREARSTPDATVASPVGGTSARVGRVAVRAERTFRFRSGDRVMVDAVTAKPHGLVDHLGRRGRLSADLRAEVDADGPDAGALRLVSTGVTFRVLGRTLRLPSVVAPRVTLVERFDDEAEVQRVSLVLSAPLLGTLYRYEGAFRYRIEPDAGGGTR